MQERVQITVLSHLDSTTSGNLEGLYFSSDPRQRELCYTFLGELALIKPDTRMIILKLLMKGVIDADIQNRATAIYYLGEISRHSPRLAQHVIYPLVMILLKSDEKQIIQFQALIALEKLNKQSMSIQKFLYKGISDVAYLTVAKLDSGDPNERKEATWKIGKLGMVFFPAILDLVHMILNLLVDEHDGVKSMAKKTVCDLIPSSKGKMLDIMADYLGNPGRLYLKLEILDIVQDIIRFNPNISPKFIPVLVQELQRPNRQLYLKVNKVLKITERIVPGYFKSHPSLLVKALKSPSRYAYHWAIKIIPAIIFPAMRETASSDFNIFVASASRFITLLLSGDDDNLMQTRVVLLMLIHEITQIISKFEGIPEGIAEGLERSINQIQKSNLGSKTEVIAAYEKLEQILRNATTILNGIHA